MIVNNARVKEKFKIHRIFFITQYFPPDYAATGQIIKELLYKLDNKENYLYTGIPSYAKNKNSKIKYFERYKNLKIYRSFLSDFWPKKMNGRIINSFLFTINSFFGLIFKTNRKDLLIYTTEPPFLICISWIIRILKKSPYIVILFDIYPELLTKLSIVRENTLVIRFWEYFNKFALTYSTEIVVLNEEMKSRIISKYNLNPNKVAVIPTWVDEKKLKFIPKKNNWFLDKYNLTNKFVIMYSGNQGRGHDFLTVLETASILKDNKDIIFVFIGNGYQNKFLNYEVKKRGIKNFLFLPFQKIEDLSYSLSAADLGIVSIKKGLEGIIAPSKLFGYFSVSVPTIVISPEKSYIKNLVERSLSGKWFLNEESGKLAKWILKVKANKSKLKEMGNNGRSFIIKNATSDICINKYKKLLDGYNIAK